MEAGISGKPASKQEVTKFRVNQLTLAVRPLLFIYLFFFFYCIYDLKQPYCICPALLN